MQIAVFRKIPHFDSFFSCTMQINQSTKLYWKAQYAICNEAMNKSCMSRFAFQ